MRMGDWKIKLKPLISMILVLMVNQAVWSAEPPAGNTDEGDRGLASGKKFALLVGIDDYDPYRQSPDDNTVSEDDLKGCVNDVTDIRKLLTDKRYAFRNDDEHIKVLTNRDATRDAIIQTFRSHLIENAKKHPDGIFVFHYSGHGATGVPDYSGEEQDNSDECIVSSDRDAILDDELAGLCKELVDQTNSKANVTLIFDCCHSGTMSRNVSGDRVRQLPAERLALEKIKKREQAKPRQGKGSEFEGQLVPESDRYVSISACASTQEEPETGGERPNGVLTRNLTDLLKDAPRWWTYRYLKERLVAQIEPVWGTRPQVEGDVFRAVLGGSTTRQDPSIAIKSVSGRAVTIKAGTTAGVNRNGIIAFYDNEAKELSGSKHLLGQGTVTEARAYEADVALANDVPQAALEKAQAVLITPGFSSAPVAVGFVTARDPRLAEPAFKRFKDELSAKMMETTGISFVTAPSENALKKQAGLDAAVVSWTFGAFENWAKGRGLDPAKGLKASPKSDEVVYILTDRSDQPLYGMCVLPSDPNAVDTILDAVRKRARQQSLLRLSNDTESPMNGAVEATIWKVTEYERKPDHPGIIVKREEPVKGTHVPFVAGEYYRLHLKNVSKEPVYVNVLALGTSGRIVPLFPVPGETEAMAPGHEEIIPRDDAIKAALPVGVDTFRIIVSDKYTDLSFLRQDAVLRGLKTRAPLEDKSGLGRLFLAGTTRELETSADLPPPDRWGTTMVEVEVLPQVPPRETATRL